MTAQQDAIRGLRRIVPLLCLAAVLLVLFWIDQRTAFWDRFIFKVSQFGQSLAEVEPDYSILPPEDHESQPERAVNDAQEQDLLVSYFPGSWASKDDREEVEQPSNAENALAQVIYGRLTRRLPPASSRQNRPNQVVHLCKAFGSELTASISDFDDGLVVVR